MNASSGPRWQDEPPTERLPVVRLLRNRIATVALVVAVLAAGLLLVPGAVAVSGLLAFAAIVCAAVAVWRSRRGRAPNRGRALTALAVAPVLFAVAVALTPAPPADTADTATAAASRTSAAPAAPAPTTVAPPPPVIAAPPTTTVPPRQTVDQVTPSEARARATAPPPRTRAVAPAAPSTRKAEPPAPARATCDTATHYVNSAGRCVLRPQKAAGAPGGATATCRDGSLSYSQSRSGTCSRHGGVAQWL